MHNIPIVLKHTSVSMIMSNAKVVKLFPIFILAFLENNQLSLHFSQCLPNKVVYIPVSSEIITSIYSTDTNCFDKVSELCN